LIVAAAMALTASTAATAKEASKPANDSGF
jgi:hypothetical protein